jgi:hypothetical protein
MRIEAMNERHHFDELQTLHSGVWTWLQSIPGIVGLGIGVNAWRVYVENESGTNRAYSLARIPQQIHGFPTEIVLKQVSFSCYGNDFQSTLKPGIQIAAKGQGEGSLGCFARLTAAPNTIVVLSNRHVLYGDVADFGSSGDGNDCGQPSVSCCCCCASHVIGENRGNGVNGFNSVVVKVTHPQSSGTFAGSEIDCAVAVLNSKRPYTNQADSYEMIQGTPASGLGVSAGDPVQKVGSTTGYTKGTILQFNTTAVYQSGGSGTVPNILWPYPIVGDDITENAAGARGNINQFLVLPDADASNPSLKTQFAASGDSGSVVVNSDKQVIGLIDRTIRILNQNGADFLNQFLTTPLPPHAGTLGVVCPIGKVLSSLGIEIVNNMQGTVTSSGAMLEVPDEVLQERERVLTLERTLQSLEREIRQQALGRTVLDKIQEHRPEAARLVERNRAVKVAWHRCQGPAYAAHCLHSFQDKQYRIPSQVNGVTPWELVQRMAGVLKTYGSERLQNDIRDYEWLAREWIEGCNSVWQLVDRLRKLESVGDMDQDKVEVTADTSVTK